MIFTLQHTDTHAKARAGLLQTDHGVIETPIFMPVGTSATVKGILPELLTRDIKAQIILGNTYHLYMRPGTAILEAAGGLHKFMNWDLPMLTDSGGYQVFSLAENRKITEEGALFQSHIDGSKHMFTPEKAVDIQRTIGADIFMAFDECTPWPCTHADAKKSMDLTHRWLDRCVTQFSNTEPKYGHSQSLFPIMQGSTFEDLRLKSAEYIASKNLDGNAIGGLSVGEPAEDMYRITEKVCEILPLDKPRYLMGVGTPANLLECIALGVDMFDCVMPTRNGRNGTLFTSNGVMNIRNLKWANDFSAVDNEITPHFSKAYLRHLFVCGEMLGPIIASIHNLTFYLNLVKTARKMILEDKFAAWKSVMVPKLMQKV